MSAPFELEADAEELYVNFRRHPSFAIYSGGNEGTFGEGLGAAFETAHPALARLPESKALSTLHFRIFKKGLRLPVAGFCREDLAVMSEGAAGCSLHLAARVTERGARHVLVYGIDLGSDLPEAQALLDGVVDLARRPVSAEERARAVAVRPASRPKASDATKSDLKVEEDRRD